MIEFIEMLVVLCGSVFAYGFGAGIAIAIVMWALDKRKCS